MPVHQTSASNEETEFKYHGFLVQYEKENDPCALDNLKTMCCRELSKPFSVTISDMTPSI